MRTHSYIAIAISVGPTVRLHDLKQCVVCRCLNVLSYFCQLFLVGGLLAKDPLPIKFDVTKIKTCTPDGSTFKFNQLEV